MPRSFAALDADFMLALEGGFSGCEAAIDLLSKAGFAFLVPPVVEESLFWLSVNAHHDAIKTLARKALGGFATYGILKDDLNGMDKMYTRNWVEKWLNENLCDGATCNDYLLVTETAQLGARLLLTGSRPILAGEQKIRHSLSDAHMNPVAFIDFQGLV